eukprot:scaffold3308_cov97-Skeletonema_dohrnii-CCMP3373.AAC.1
MRLPLKGFQLPASHESDRIIRVHYPQGLWGFLPKVFDYLHQNTKRSLSSRFMGLPPKGLRLPAPKH